MSQYIIHANNIKPQHQHEGYYTPNLSYKPVIKFDGVAKVFPPDNAKNDTKHPVVRYDWKAYDKSGKLVKTYGSSISCDWRMLSDKVFIEKQIKGRDFSNGRFWYVDGEVSNTELAKAANAIQLALKEYAKSYPEFVAAPHPQHSGYYSPNLRHSDEEDVIDCTSDTNKPDYLSVKMSAIDDLDDNYLEHHGVKGQKWGVINDKPTDPRQRTRSSSGHPYYSPNTGNSSNSTNSVIKRDTNPGKNTSTSTKKTYYTADLSQKPLSDKDGVHYVIGIGNSGYGAQITVQSNVITSTLDRKEDLAAMVKNQVIQGIDSFRNNPRYGEPYKNLYLTDKQIDSIVWSLVYKIEKDWKKNYYKPGNY